MPVKACCPSCSKVYNLADHLAGKQIRCKECNGVFRVPQENPPAGTGAPAGKPPGPSGSPMPSPPLKQVAREKRAVRPPADDPEEARPAKKGRKADVPEPPSGKESSGKRKKGSRPPAVPKDVRSAMALLILVAFIQGVGLFMIYNATSELYLNSDQRLALKIATAAIGGMICLALGAAFLLRAGSRLGRVLTFLVAILSILLGLAAVVVGNWVVLAVWLGIGIAILMFADTKGVRQYIRDRNRRTPAKEEGDEDAGTQDHKEAPGEEEEKEDPGSRPRRKK